jgi:hypothetical protein
MSTFGKQVSDEDWSSEALPLYRTAEPLVSRLCRANEGQATDDLADAVQEVLARLPAVVEATEGLPNPQSAEAKSASSHFRLALKDCLKSAKYAETMYRDLAGGPGRRMQYEPGMAQRAAAGRISGSKHWSEVFTKSAAEHMQIARIYFAPQLQQAPISLVGVILLPVWNHFVEKRALGGNYIQFGRFLTGVTYLYQTGAIIGCSKRDKLDILGRIMASPGHEVEFWAACQDAAKKRRQEFGKEPTSIYDLVWSTELAKVGLKFPDFSDFENTSKRFYEKLPCDGRLENVMKMFVVEGIGFGSVYPDLTERLWTKSQEPIEKDQWSLLKRFGVDLPEAPAAVSFEQQTQNTDEILAAYVSEYYPDLMGLLNLRRPSQTAWEKTQTETNPSEAHVAYCTKCGRKNDSQANYCRDCGTPIVVAPRLLAKQRVAKTHLTVTARAVQELKAIQSANTTDKRHVLRIDIDSESGGYSLWLGPEQKGDTVVGSENTVLLRASPEVNKLLEKTSVVVDCADGRLIVYPEDATP